MGELPAYLDSLQEKESAPLTRGGEELYAALRGDLHMHSDWSDGGIPIEEMVLTAVELGQEWTALTDHSPRLTVANGLSAERLTNSCQRRRRSTRASATRSRLLKGIEVDIHVEGDLDQDDDMLDRLDVVTASIHSKLRQPRSR